MPTTFLLVVFLLALAAISPGMLVVSIGLYFFRRLRYLGRQMLVYGLAAMLFFGFAFAALVIIFGSMPNEPWQTVLVALGSGFSIGSLGCAAWAVLYRVRSNYSSKRTRVPRAA